MKDYIKIWKEKANNKDISASDMVTYCALKAIKAKAENKEELFFIFLNKSFTPHKQNGYAARKLASRNAKAYLKFHDKVLGVKYSEIFETEEERALFEGLLSTSQG